MKRWIVKNFIQLSEITERPVPNWVRKLLKSNEFAAMESSEKDITRALGTSRQERVTMPEELKERIEEAGRSTTPVPLPVERIFPSVSWAMAAAALLILGTVFIFWMPSEQGVDPDSSNLLVENPVNPEQSPVGVDSAREPGNAAEDLAGDLLLNPLATEQERLATDVANALQYVAESVLPSAYAMPVNEGLRSAHQRLTKSI